MLRGKSGVYQGSRGRQGLPGVKGDVRGIQGCQVGVQVSRGVKRGVRGVPRVKGEGSRYPRGSRGVLGVKGSLGDPRGQRGRRVCIRGSRERHSDLILLIYFITYFCKIK